ncbi:MAG: FmdB family transcriptional regulator [Ignavibacteriae bacterium]|nr:FmdB family transcriptional regulator [Ignavibacteriota bacterium]
MPTYDYKCLDCGNLFEAFQKMTDEPLTECPNCGGNVKRLIGTGLSPIFKGNGFYQTDYKNSSPTNETKSKENNSENKTAAKTETTTESQSKNKETKKAG